MRMMDRYVGPSRDRFCRVRYHWIERNGQEKDHNEQIA
jgi:hypothetical protein